MEAISNRELEKQIKFGSPNLSIGKCATIRPEIADIEYKGTRLKNCVYCKVCHKVLSLCKGTTGNIVRHCKSHVQSGSGIIEQKQAVNYHYPVTNLSKKQYDVTPVATRMADSHVLPEHITSDTLLYLKESNLLPPQPNLSIRKVLKIEIQEGIPMAHVEWNDPSMWSTWIPAPNLLHYYIYDTKIQYDEDDEGSMDSQSGNGYHKSVKSHLSILQKRALRQRKRVHQRHH